MAPLRSLISFVLMFSLLPTLFHGPLRQVIRADTNDEVGLQFRLSHGIDRPEAKPPTKVSTATELSQAETDQILTRLPPMKVDPGSVQEFALREGSLPPPRTGQTIDKNVRQKTEANKSKIAPSFPLKPKGQP
jgi:hypothetical protein